MMMMKTLLLLYPSWRHHYLSDREMKGGVAMTATLGKNFVIVAVAISSAAIGDAINKFPKVIPNDRVDNTFNHNFSIFGDLLM